MQQQQQEEDTETAVDPSTFSSTGSSFILSDKVQRALQVRTDTAAMRAALEALSHLPTAAAAMDSRSVRVAIEQDALNQALLLEEELLTLLKTIQQLRKGVSETAKMAHSIHAAISENVVSDNNTMTSTTTTTSMTSTTKDDMDDDHQEENNQEDNNTTTLDEEEQLASLLADAFYERSEAQQRVETVTAFLEKFNLSENDSVLLDTYNFEDISSPNNNNNNNSNNNTLVGMQFLSALERVRIIRQQLTATFGPTTATTTTSSSSRLLDSTSESGNNKKQFGAGSAVRMMESLAQKQERAYERLYHFLQNYLKLNAHVPTSSSMDTLQQQHVDPDAMDEALSHPFVREALKTLKYVPAFYSHTLELIANARRAEETRRFLLALSSGYNGRPPIEVKAHDPVNYIGDMLAFAFQTASEEADVAKGLVVVVVGEEGQKSRKDDSMDDDDDEFNMSSAPSSSMTAADMLAHAMSGIARPLKHRIMQVIATLARTHHHHHHDEEVDDDEDDEEGAAARTRVSSLYSICGLLLFYRSALDKAVHKLAVEKGHDMPEDNPLVTAIVECLKEGCEGYAASLRVYAAMLESIHVMTGESEAALVQAMMTQLTRVRSDSPGFSAEVACPSELKASLSLEFACETLLEAALSSCSSLDHTVALKLTLTTAKKAGLSTTVASKLDGMISSKEQSMIDGIVENETVAVLDLCGLGSCYSAWKSMLDVDGVTMAAHSGLTPEDVESSMKEFYSSLYSPPLPSFENIKDPVLRKLAKSKIAETVCRTYQELFEAMHSEKGGYDDLSFLQYTPDQVKTLFSV